MKYPVPPYPSVGEIAYECAVRSGLVRSNDGSKLYDRLKAFKDDRKRPGLRPIEFPAEVLVALEQRLAEFLGDEDLALVIFMGFRRWLDQYSGIVATHDATLLERDQILELLWPTLFAAVSNFFIASIRQIHPLIDPVTLLRDPAPLGCYIRLICTQGTQDHKLICEYRATQADIDFDNCRDTLDTWLKGTAVPSLDNCLDVLRSLQLDGVAAKVWLLAARLLAKTPEKYRAAILSRWQSEDNKSPEEEFFWLKRTLAWEVGLKLNIGPDRPYSALIEALYNPDVPRDAFDVQDMLERLERTWQPITGQTFHTIAWLRGRFLVLSGQYETAMGHYLDAYNLGCGRDPDIYRKVLDEALALAGKLGKKRMVERFHGLLGLYWTTEWDGDFATLNDHFNRKFRSELFYQDMS